MLAQVLTITPKAETVRHRKQQITLTYIPATGEWGYKVEYTVRNVLLFDGTGKRRQDALLKARRVIDRMIDGE